MCLLLVLLQVWSVLRNISNLQVDSNRLNGTLPKVRGPLQCKVVELTRGRGKADAVDLMKVEGDAAKQM